jgi:hypothetical protein
MSYTCEKCGKVTEEKFGSGRFCSRACANSRAHSAETKERIRQGITKHTSCQCQFCGKEFNNLNACRSHERLCKLNPNALLNPAKLSTKKSQRHVIIYTTPKVTLDITYSELDQYRTLHQVCEICGKSVKDTVKYTGKFAAKQLCVDHDHETNKFRGLLCQVCNRQLGWYENNKENIQKYLDK